LDSPPGPVHLGLRGVGCGRVCAGGRVTLISLCVHFPADRTADREDSHVCRLLMPIDWIDSHCGRHRPAAPIFTERGVASDGLWAVSRDVKNRCVD